MTHKKIIYSFLLFLFSCHSSLSVHAATLIHNIKGYSVNGQGLQKFDGLLINDDGRVDQTLDSAALTNALTHEEYTLVDGKGRTLLPGLIDAHGHVSSLGMALSSVDVVDIQSANEAAQRVSSFIKKNPSIEWVTGRGWNQELWSNNQFPTAAVLDKVSPNKPVVLVRIDGHAMWLNSEAMRRAGINQNTPDVAGGGIIKNANGLPTGILVDNAMDLIEKSMPALTLKQTASAFSKAFGVLASEGLTSVHDAGISPVEVEAYKLLGTQNKLLVRIYAMLGANFEGYQTELERGIEPTLFDDKLSIRSIKISLDGALGSRGAALDEPYSDRHDTRGLLLYKPAKAEKIIAQAMRAGFQVNTHAIGDRSNQLLLNIFEKYPQYKSLRNRNEHAQVLHLNDINRFKSIGVIPSMQPTHATSDKNMAGDRLGEKRLEGAYAWRKFLDSGVIIAGGSDFPVEPSNPFFGLHAAVTRQDRKNQPENGWRAEEKMTREEALRAFTLDAAFAAHQEKVIGSLEKGKWADFILIDQDYFNMPEKDIWKIKVMQTWQAGKSIYCADCTNQND